MNHMGLYCGLLLLLCAACSPVEVTVSSGEYAVSDVDKRKDDRSRRDLLSSPIEHELMGVVVSIDRGENQVTVRNGKGEEAAFEFESRSSENWVVGCPGTFRDHAEEVLELSGAVKLGALEIAKPIIVAKCPDGAGAVLRESGSFSEVNDRCAGADGFCLELSKK